MVGAPWCKARRDRVSVDLCYSDYQQAAKPPTVKAVAQRQKSGFQISYVTITYRSVWLACMAVVALACFVLSLIFPVITDRIVAAGETGLTKLVAKIGLGETASG